MSKPGGKRGPPKTSAKNPPVTADDSITNTNKTDNDGKDDMPNADKKETKSGDEAQTTQTSHTGPKPQSAGATIRDAGQKLLVLTMKQEWTAIDPILKQLEKIVVAAGSEANLTPLAGVTDPVSIIFLSVTSIVCSSITLFLHYCSH